MFPTRTVWRLAGRTPETPCARTGCTPFRQARVAEETNGHYTAFQPVLGMGTTQVVDKIVGGDEVRLNSL